MKVSTMFRVVHGRSFHPKSDHFEKNTQSCPPFGSFGWFGDQLVKLRLEPSLHSCEFSVPLSCSPIQARVTNYMGEENKRKEY